MKKYRVTCTKIYNGEIVVLASSSAEAVKRAQDHIDLLDEQNHWDFGEATADYADEEE